MDKREDEELRQAQRAARENLHRNAGRNQVEFEHRVDVAEKRAKR